MNEREQDLSENVAFQHLRPTQIKKTDTLERIIKRMQIPSGRLSAPKGEMEHIALNPDVSAWINKIGFATRTTYIRRLCYFLRSVELTPSDLLDLKLSEDPKRRYFPAERLIETWIELARQCGLSRSRISVVVTTVGSFFTHNRAPLVQVTFAYKPKPKPKPTLDEKLLRRFRDEGFTEYGKIVFDFLLSVSIRIGQFQQCKGCGEDFYPRWRNILSFPRIEPYSPFVIKTEKGHESDRYPNGITQVCYLTKTSADGLNKLLHFKEEKLERKISKDEYIFTLQQEHVGKGYVAPQTHWALQAYFQDAAKQTNIPVTPNVLRSWTNTILASRGIEKQIRDIYLGHTSAYELNYIVQMIPTWKQTLKEAKALEYLDFIAGPPKQEPVSKNNRFGPLNTEDVEQLENLLKRLKEHGYSKN